jgi:hypothetical protein
MDTEAPKVESFEVCIDAFFVKTLVLPGLTGENEGKRGG